MLPIIGVLYPPPHASLTCIVFIYIQIESLNCVVLYIVKADLHYTTLA
jgi:hypothetical protein